MLGDRVVPMQDQAADVARDGSVPEILDLAVKMEDDSVSFYSDLLRAVDPKDAEAIQTIIDEEKRHSLALAEARQALQA